MWGTCSTCWSKHGVNTRLQRLLLLAKKLASVMYTCAGESSAAVAIVYACQSNTAVAMLKSRGNGLTKAWPGTPCGSYGGPATSHTCNILLTTTSSCRRRNVG